MRLSGREVEVVKEMAEGLILLGHYNDMLTYSYNTCEEIGIKIDYTFE